MQIVPKTGRFAFFLFNYFVILSELPNFAENNYLKLHEK